MSILNFVASILLLNMGHITVAVEDNVVGRARMAAHAMGLGLEQFLCEQIERLAENAQIVEDHYAYEARARTGIGRLDGRKPNRDDANARATEDTPSSKLL